MSDEAYYEETQRLPGWVLTLVALTAGTSIAVFGIGFYVQFGKGEPWGSNPMSDGALLVTGIAFIVFGLALIWLFASLKLITEIRADSVHVRFAPMRTKRIPLDNIATAEVRTVRPIRDFGGWGVRYAKGVRAYLARGNRGIYLTTLDGRDILIGSQAPDDFAAALRTWLPRWTV